jgi:hypothetical protein
MLPFIVVAAAAVLVVAFTKRNRFEPSVRRANARLKAAAREVDNSATAVEIALKPLMAAI